MLEIKALRQGVYKSISSFWTKIKKYGDQLDYTLVQKKPHFLSGVRPDIRDEIYRIGQTKPINNIINSLAKLELCHRILQKAPSQPYYVPIASAISDVISQQPAFPMADMQKIIQDFYLIKLEKPWQAFYIIDQEDNNIDPLSQDSDYLKYLEQAKVLYKKPQRSNQSVRMNRIKEGLNETQDTINQLADQLQKKVYIKKYEICKKTGHSKGKCPNQSIVQFNYTRSYFISLKPIYLQYTLPNSDDSEKDEVTESKQNEKITMPNLFPKSDDQLLELLSLAIIEDIIISDGFADAVSGCLVMNKVLNEALGWNLGMAPNFFLRHNSDHITKLEEGHKDVPISIKYKNKWVTETEHVVDNNSKNQTFDSSTKIDTKEEPASYEKKETKLEFYSKIQIISEKLNQYINDKNQNDLIKKQLKEEIKELKSKNTNLTEYKAKYYSKLEEANSFQSRIKSLEEELSLTQKYSSKKDSKIMFFKTELVNIKIELDSKISELKRLKLEDISISVVGGNSEKNISKFRPKESLFCNNNISAVSETSKNPSQYFAYKKIINKIKKISTNIPTHANNKIVSILESSKINTEITSKIKRSKELPIIALGTSIINKYQTTPINSYEDVSKTICRYTDDIKNASMVINSYLCKSKFIVFNLNRPKDDLLAIQLKFDTSLNLQKEIELRQKHKIKNILSAEPTL
ncbi:19305_t:CDS:2 [Cetraspora pellucida]|uniref:19305_t:CDS:1 n=1 Tax=Cetraspora pellucida TaxID=1433469 RepID=A0A9N9BHY1_9GLOM|nr:19305_t:CDS:2 [Cetraspora pellucida]